MKIRGANLFIVGNVGPWPIVGDAIAAGVVERMLADGAERQLTMRVGESTVAARVTHAEVVHPTPTQAAISLDVEIEDGALDAKQTSTLLATAQALTDATDEQ